MSTIQPGLSYCRLSVPGFDDGGPAIVTRISDKEIFRIHLHAVATGDGSAPSLPGYGAISWQGSRV